MHSHDQPTFAALLEAAVNEPGTLHAGYSAFWNYSIGNVLLAIGQCRQRGIQAGPLATFQGWKEKGRHVRKGEKALTLCIPITIRRAANDEQEEGTFTRFVFRPRWFRCGRPTAPTTRRSPRPHGIDHGPCTRLASKRLPSSCSMATAKATRPDDGLRCRPWLSSRLKRRVMSARTSCCIPPKATTGMTTARRRT